MSMPHPGHFVDLDLSWLQATGETKYLDSDSPTAMLDTSLLWGHKYEKLMNQYKVNASKFFTGKDFGADILVEVVRGAISITVSNKHNGAMLDSIRYGLNDSRSHRTIRHWLALHTRSKDEVKQIQSWIKETIKIDKF